MKRFIGWARVSSEQQKLSGHSLAVQEGKLSEFAKQHGGTITKLFSVAESAKTSDARKQFKEMLQYAKQNKDKVDCIVFDRVDRASRNIFDSVELLSIRRDFGIDIKFVEQDLDLNNPHDKFIFTLLTAIAELDNDNKSVIVVASMKKRVVQDGLFACKAPYGYRNVRSKDGKRRLIELDPVQASRIRRIFDLYAYHNHTLDSLLVTLEKEGVVYTDKLAKFRRSKLDRILKDRSYIGEVNYCDEWFPGAHEPIIDATTFQKVQTLLGSHIYRAHEMTYAGELIRCAHCGHPITGETKTKKTKNGLKEYVYYRCARYNTDGHPRDRVTEAWLDAAMFEIFDSIKVQDDEVRNWIVKLLRTKSKANEKEIKNRKADIQAQLTRVETQLEMLLNMRLNDELSKEGYAKKSLELRDKQAAMRFQMEACDRNSSESADLVVQAFELSQNLKGKWLTADFGEKRTIIEIVCLNLQLDSVSLCFTIRKPFDVFAEGLDLPEGIPSGI